MEGETGETKQTVWWWVAGGVVLVALIWALIAAGVFDRGTLGSEEADKAADEFMEKAEEFQETATQVTARLKARGDLLALEADMKALKDPEALEEKVAAIRAELSVAYENASRTVEQQWATIDGAFASLEESIRTKSATTVEAWNGLIMRLEIEQ